MDRAEKIGGSAAHDQRREGAVTPREHNLKRTGGTTSPAQERLADPDRPHGEPSGRERRRAMERGEGDAASPTPSEDARARSSAAESGDDDGGVRPPRPSQAEGER